MRKFSLLSIAISSLLLIFITTSSCGSKSVNPPPVPSEATLSVTTNPVVGSNNAPAAIASGQPLVVTVTSIMPTGGVKIEVTSRLEGGSSDFFTGGSPSTTAAANNYNITGTPAGGAACVCSIKVTSLTTATNIWTGTFRYASK